MESTRTTLYGMKTSDTYLQFFEAGAMSDRRNISVFTAIRWRMYYSGRQVPHVNIIGDCPLVLELQDSAGCIMYIFMSPIFRYYKRFSQPYVRTVSGWPRLDTGCIIKIERRIFCNSPLIALSKKKNTF